MFFLGGTLYANHHYRFWPNIGRKCECNLQVAQLLLPCGAHHGNNFSTRWLYMDKANKLPSDFGPKQ